MSEIEILIAEARAAAMWEVSDRRQTLLIALADALEELTRGDET